MFSKEEISRIKNLVKKSKNILILTHNNPDGDAIGSSLSLYNYFEKIGVSSKILVPNYFPDFFKWLPNSDKIIIGEQYKNEIEKLFKEAELIFCLDFNSSNRIDFLGLYLENSKAQKILIDHHQNPEKFDFIYSDVSQPATCQMIYYFLRDFSENKFLDKNIAYCLYTGIFTDTGSFRFSNTTSQTHDIISELIRCGVEPDLVASNVLDTNTLDRIKLLGELFESIEILKDGKVAILYLSKEQMNKYNFKKGYSEGFVNYGLSIQGVRFVAFFMEDLHKDNFIKISFRSKGNIDVNKFSRKYFSGGGHMNASGGGSFDNLGNTIKKFKKIILNEELS